MMKAGLGLMLLWCATNLCAAQQMPHGWSQAQRVEAFSRFWSEVKRNSFYFINVGTARWDSAYRAMLPQVLDMNKSDYDFLLMMERMCGLLNDGHTGVWGQTSTINYTTNYFEGKRKFSFMWIDGKVIPYEMDEATAREVPIGSVVYSVDGKPADRYLKESVVPYVSQNNFSVRMNDAAGRLLRGQKGTKHEVVFKTPDGGYKTLQLVNGYEGEPKCKMIPAADWLFNFDKFSFRWLKKGIAYIKVGTCMDRGIVNQIDSLMPTLKKARGVVLDLRNNGGGNSSISAEILSRFTQRNVFYGERMRTRVYKPAMASWGVGIAPKDTVGNQWEKEVYCMAHDLDTIGGDLGVNGNQFEADRPHVELPMVILQNRRTASAAEDLLLMTDSMTNIVRMGKASCGSTGNPLMYNPVPGINFRICTLECTYPDGRKFVGPGVLPHVEVPVTLKDLMQKKDVQIEAAIENLEQRLKRTGK